MNSKLCICIAQSNDQELIVCRYYRMIMNYKYRKYRIKYPAVDFVQLRSSSEPA